jgi:hypothetical protein
MKQLKLLVILLLANFSACSQLLELFVSQVYTHPIPGYNYANAAYFEGYKTYVVSVKLGNPDDLITTIYGTPDPGPDGNPRPLYITYEGDCYDSPWGYHVGNDIPEDACWWVNNVFIDHCLDTYLTLRDLAKWSPGPQHCGFFNTANTALIDPPNFPNNTCDTYINDGFIYTLQPTVCNPIDDSQYYVVLYITTNDKFSFCTNVAGYQYGLTSQLMEAYFCLEDVLAGCRNPEHPDYDPEANVSDGSCPDPEGCMDPEAANYNPIALVDSGMCFYAGCTNPEACNYEPDVSVDNGTCILPGCMDNNACNYDAGAVCEGVCTFPGCIDPAACNFDPNAACSNDSCVFAGCLDAAACNYNPNAGCEGICSYPDCIDPQACNFNPEAECSNSSCIYPGCWDESACNYEPDVPCEGGECLYPGCIDRIACNYNQFAGCHDGNLCTYLPLFEITGETQVNVGESKVYHYTTTLNSTLAWDIVNGNIVSVQSNTTMVVQWPALGVGQVKITETNAEGCVGETVVKDVQIGPLTAEELNSANSIRVQPNPADHTIMLFVPDAWETFTYTLYSTSGEMVQQKNNNKGSSVLIDVSNLSEGGYIVTATYADYSESTQIIVKH